jgi:hypothetical protein
MQRHRLPAGRPEERLETGRQESSSSQQAFKLIHLFAVIIFKLHGNTPNGK